MIHQLRALVEGGVEGGDVSYFHQKDAPSPVRSCSRGGGVCVGGQLWTAWWAEDEGTAAGQIFFRVVGGGVASAPTSQPTLSQAQLSPFFIPCSNCGPHIGSFSTIFGAPTHGVGRAGCRPVMKAGARHKVCTIAGENVSTPPFFFSLLYVIYCP